MLLHRNIERVDNRRQAALILVNHGRSCIRFGGARTLSSAPTTLAADFSVASQTRSRPSAVTVFTSSRSVSVASVIYRASLVLLRSANHRVKKISRERSGDYVANSFRNTSPVFSTSCSCSRLIRRVTRTSSAAIAPTRVQAGASAVLDMDQRMCGVPLRLGEITSDTRGQI